jgi:SAM-dependent methyltransferase
LGFHRLFESVILYCSCFCLIIFENGVLMKWTNKAKIMKFCAALPLGSLIYKEIQKKFGRLTSEPSSRLTTAKKMAEFISNNGRKIEGKTFFEVGTGHVPVVPIGLFLCGAEKTVTVDLNRRLDLDLLGGALDWIALHSNQLEEEYASVVDAATFRKRLSLVSAFRNAPDQFLKEANISYLAPADASKVDLSASSIDYHISNTVMEHIPAETIKKIFTEGKRLLKKDGLFVQFIDLSDHFKHQDKTISSINFLKYSDSKWLSMAGNQFAYCNRLRASDFTALFSELGLSTVDIQSEIDQESLNFLRNGFHLDKRFADYDHEDLSKTSLQLILRH